VDGSGANINPTPATKPLERFPDPPKPEGKNVTPWQAAIDTAAMLIAAATLLLMLAARAAKHPAGKAVPTIAYVLAAAAAALGLTALAFGSIIASGKFGLVFLVNFFVLSGGLMGAAGAAAAMGFRDPKSSMATEGKPSLIMMASGAAALGAAMAGYLTAPKKIPAERFQDGRAPDWDHRAEGGMPSQEALNHYLA
jgi:hypothetical protein